MNKTDRMLAIVLELQRKGTLRAADLAEKFETSARTIYRDVQALSEAGVPVVGSPGQGYSLMDGYFLPPVGFTAEEAVTLLLGLDMVTGQFDASYAAKATMARSKIEAILPGTVLEESRRMRSAWKMIERNASSGSRDREAASNGLPLLRQAILEERVVQFLYTKTRPAAGSERETVREAEPYGLVRTGGAWMLVAHCRQRQDIRHFRLSRIRELILRDERFSRPAGFDLQAYRPVDDRNVAVQLLFRPELEAALHENDYYYLETIESVDNGILVTLRVRQPEEALQWVLGWGAGVTVLAPEPLRLRMAEECRSMLESY
ncbi:YafY family protein [Paenibacillus hodogayensis]|uniref:YafY family protein n=1 Tax=Paenibacillus hodogayensis TaxID=279208 RepID=A0ABV5VSN1_9BACL